MPGGQCRSPCKQARGKHGAWEALVDYLGLKKHSMNHLVVNDVKMRMRPIRLRMTKLARIYLVWYLGVTNPGRFVMRLIITDHLKSGSCSWRYSLYQDRCLKNKKMWLMCLLLFLSWKFITSVDIQFFSIKDLPVDEAWPKNNQETKWEQSDTEE